jgi:hypothetical protein
MSSQFGGSSYARYLREWHEEWSRAPGEGPDGALPFGALFVLDALVTADPGELTLAECVALWSVCPDHHQGRGRALRKLACHFFKHPTFGDDTAELLIGWLGADAPLEADIGDLPVSEVLRCLREAIACRDAGGPEVPPARLDPRVLGLPPDCPRAAVPAAGVPDAAWLGDGRVRVGPDLLTLAPQYADALEALLRLGGTATGPELDERSGRRRAGALLRALVKRHPCLGPHIRCPGRRGGGGYSTTVQLPPPSAPA